MIIISRKMRGSRQVARMTDMSNTWHFGISKVLTGLAMKKYCLIQCDDNVVGIYQFFGETCCLILHGRSVTEAGSSSNSLTDF
jgi:hypothetical protein